MKQFRLLATFLFTALLIGCSSKSSQKLNESNLVNGFTIPLPENWIDNSNYSIKENISKFNLTENDVNKLLQTHNGSVPVAIYSKYDPNQYVGPIPTIQVNLRPNPTRSFTEFKNDMERNMKEMGNYFQNFKILNPLEETKIDSVTGLYFISQFEMSNHMGETWKIRSWSYAFPAGEYFFQINFSDTENENSEEVYNKIISEVKFRK